MKKLVAILLTFFVFTTIHAQMDVLEKDQDISRKAGKGFFGSVNAFYDEKKLNIQQSLKDEKAVTVKDFPLKELLENEY